MAVDWSLWLASCFFSFLKAQSVLVQHGLRDHHISLSASLSSLCFSQPTNLLVVTVQYYLEVCWSCQTCTHNRHTLCVLHTSVTRPSTLDHAGFVLARTIASVRPMARVRASAMARVRPLVSVRAMAKVRPKATGLEHWK